MGEIAEDILEGRACESCGQYFPDEAPGYPRECDECSGGEVMDYAAIKEAAKVRKMARLEVFLAHADERGWRQLSVNHHYRKTIGKVNFDYWPTTATVSWRGQIFKGVGPETIEHFVANRVDR